MIYLFCVYIMLYFESKINNLILFIMKANLLQEIHESLLNGQRKQMVNQIDEYGLYDFFEDYNTLLCNLYSTHQSKHEYFLDCVVSYHRIKNR